MEKDEMIKQLDESMQQCEQEFNMVNSQIAQLESQLNQLEIRKQQIRGQYTAYNDMKRRVLGVKSEDSEANAETNVDKELEPVSEEEMEDIEEDICEDCIEEAPEVEEVSKKEIAPDEATPVKKEEEPKQVKTEPAKVENILEALKINQTQKRDDVPDYLK